MNNSDPVGSSSSFEESFGSKQSHEFRLWFVCPLHFDAKDFLSLRRSLLQKIEGLPELAPASIHFALFVESSVDKTIGHELSSLPEVTVISTADNLSQSKLLADGLRILRGTLREEDVIVSITKEYFNNTRLIAQMVKAVFHNYYNPKRVILGPSALEKVSSEVEFDSEENQVEAQPGIAAFYGWHVQFQLKSDGFDNDFTGALRELKVPLIELHDIEFESTTSKAKSMAQIFPQNWKESFVQHANRLNLIPMKDNSSNDWTERLQRIPLLFQRVMISALVLIGIITALVVFVSPQVDASKPNLQKPAAAKVKP